MNWLDILIFVVGGIIALVGWRMGGSRIAVTALGIVVGLALAGRLHDDVGSLVSRLTDNDDAAYLGGFIAILALVLVASLLVSFLLRTLLKKFMIGPADKLAGLALGVVVSFVIGSGALSAIQSYPVWDMDSAIEDSAVGTFLADRFDVILRGAKFIPDDLGTKFIPDDQGT